MIEGTPFTFEVLLCACFCSHAPDQTSARIDTPGALHHIMARGIERRKRFRDKKRVYGFPGPADPHPDGEQELGMTMTALARASGLSVPAMVERFLRNRQTLTKSPKVVKLTICQCNSDGLRGGPAMVERFLRNRQTLTGRGVSHNQGKWCPSGQWHPTWGVDTGRRQCPGGIGKLEGYPRRRKKSGDHGLRGHLGEIKTDGITKRRKADYLPM